MTTYALRMTPPDLGKTEAWYIVDAEPGAVLYAGLKQGVNQKQNSSAAIAIWRTLKSCLHRIEPKRGDCVFIPAGTVHASRRQVCWSPKSSKHPIQHFDLFDWNRVDANGNPRALHVEQSLQVIDFDMWTDDPLQITEHPLEQGRERLVSCEKFNFDRLITGSNRLGGGRANSFA